VIFNPLGCCGIKEIQGLSNWQAYPDSFYHAIKDHNGGLPCAWVCFNGVRAGGYVAAFARFLEQEKLGTVISLPDIVNPNSNNMLDVRMWQVDQVALRAWYQRRLKSTQVCGCYTCEGRRQAETEAARRRQEQAAQLDARTAASSTPPLSYNSGSPSPF
jgi:hypothetical protein